MALANTWTTPTASIDNIILVNGALKRYVADLDVEEYKSLSSSEKVDLIVKWRNEDRNVKPRLFANSSSDNGEIGQPRLD